ncbi:MAG: hypothetical protein PUE13_05735, partial [Clostridiales bacterium]|nr:hypothetical protein [Clostridiales bacterium]
MKKRCIISLLLSGLMLIASSSPAYCEMSFTEDCEQLALQNYTSNTENIDLGGGWGTNSVMGGGTASCAVMSGVSGADGNCFRLGAKGTAGNYGDYPGIIYSGGNAKTGEEQEISIRFALSSINAEMGVRFMKNGSDFYELVLPKKDTKLAVLNKVTGGRRTALAEISGTKAMTKNEWYKLTVTISAAGEIEWKVTDDNDNTLIPSPDGVYTDSIPFDTGKTAAIELIAGGYGSGYVYFDDITYESRSCLYKFTENFEDTDLVSYSAVFVDTETEDDTVVDSRNKPIGDKWTTNSIMGYDSRAYAAVISEDVGTEGKCLAISARAEWQKYNVYPGVILNELPMPRGTEQHISFKFRAKDGLWGGGGAGIRFLKNGSDFYELIFPRLDSGYRVIFNKVSGGTRETVYTLPNTAGCRSSD